ncbi:hypothetical protein OF83DRAFT_1226273, partial [Amylostereum chailletii]
LRQGCLSSAPRTVSFAISLRTLDLYRRLRVRQPRVSVQAWVCVLCDLHNMPYSWQLWRMFTDTFNVYLRILRGIDARVNSILKRTDANWCVTHSCPSCQYKLVDDPPLRVAVISALDGNQSLKRVRLREGLEADPHTFQSTYYVPEEEVNRFQYDVKARAERPKATVADGDDNDTTCTDRWKAAMNDNLKRMWAIYRETGIFPSACRHGMIWWFCDMVESGELAKYPLALLELILDIFGDDVRLGYDIGCSFTATIKKSSLARKALLCRLRMVVPAFHGYAHNHLCQLLFHPLMLLRFGIEDLELCERIFAAFNGLANSMPPRSTASKVSTSSHNNGTTTNILSCQTF